MPVPSKEEKQAALVLTPEDVERLLKDDTSEIRLSMTDKIAGAYGNGGSFNEKESQIAEQIFRLMLRDTEVKVRAAMAEQLKASGQIPKDIVMTMARDVEEVALPVLRYSEVLSDKDLMQIIGETNTAKHVAISQRHSVSGMISGALVQLGNTEVVGELVKNGGAEIPKETMEKIIADHSTEKTLMEALAERQALPAGVAEKLVAHVSSALAGALKEKYNIVSDQIAEQAEKTRETATAGILRYSMTDEELDALVKGLLAYKRLTPSIILNGLCQGNWRFFNLSLAKLAGIPVENANKLLLDKGGMGFKALYKKTGITDTMYGPVRLLYHTVRDLFEEHVTPMEKDFPNKVVSRLLEAAEGEDIENLSYIIALVRKGS